MQPLRIPSSENDQRYMAGMVDSSRSALSTKSRQVASQRTDLQEDRSIRYVNGRRVLVEEGSVPGVGIGLLVLDPADLC